MWGAVWAVCKVMYMFGEYKGKQEEFKDNTEKAMNKLNVTFMSFSTKLDNVNKNLEKQGESIAKLEGKIEEISKK